MSKQGERRKKEVRFFYNSEQEKTFPGLRRATPEDSDRKVLFLLGK